MQKTKSEKNFFKYWKNIKYELRIQKERKWYNKVMELHSFYQDIWYKLGLVYDAIGDKEKAKEYFIRSKS